MKRMLNSELLYLVSLNMFYSTRTITYIYMERYRWHITLPPPKEESKPIATSVKSMFSDVLGQAPGGEVLRRE
jgi:hypothetical protein